MPFIYIDVYQYVQFRHYYSFRSQKIRQVSLSLKHRVKREINSGLLSNKEVSKVARVSKIIQQIENHYN